MQIVSIKVQARKQKPLKGFHKRGLSFGEWHCSHTRDRQAEKANIGHWGDTRVVNPELCHGPRAGRHPEEADLPKSRERAGVGDLFALSGASMACLAETETKNVTQPLHRGCLSWVMNNLPSLLLYSGLLPLPFIGWTYTEARANGVRRRCSLCYRLEHKKGRGWIRGLAFLLLSNHSYP